MWAAFEKARRNPQDDLQSLPCLQRAGTFSNFRRAGGRSEKAGRGKKECVPGTASVGLSALSCLGVGGWGVALQVIKSFLCHRDPPSHQDVQWLGK